MTAVHDQGCSDSGKEAKSDAKKPKLKQAVVSGRPRACSDYV